MLKGRGRVALQENFFFGGGGATRPIKTCRSPVMIVLVVCCFSAPLWLSHILGVSHGGFQPIEYLLGPG